MLVLPAYPLLHLLICYFSTCLDLVPVSLHALPAKSISGSGHPVEPGIVSGVNLGNDTAAPIINTTRTTVTNASAASTTTVGAGATQSVASMGVSQVPVTATANLVGPTDRP